MTQGRFANVHLPADLVGKENRWSVRTVFPVYGDEPNAKFCLRPGRGLSDLPAPP